MAPQESNVVIGTKRQTQLTDILAFPAPKKRKKNRKKKNAHAIDPNSLNSKAKKFSENIDVITLDSDDSHDNFEKLDDDVVVIENPVDKIDLSYKIRNRETVNLENDNIVINIDQPVNVDHILQHETFDSSNDEPLPPGTANLEPILLNDESVSHPSTSVVTDYPKSWTKEMVDYYTKPCEKNRNFDYVKILKTMMSKPTDWYISMADKYSIPQQKKRYIQCRKCQRNGHMESECKKNVVCFICGEFNHVYFRCPNTLCLTCGKRTPKNVNSCNNCQKVLSSKQYCALCGQMYHSEQMCPSKWRQYLILSDSTVPAIPNPRKFCYNCAGKGHFGFECPRTPYSEYPLENPIITTLVNRTEPLRSADDNNNRRNSVIRLHAETTKQLATKEGARFLKNFVNNHQIRVEFAPRPCGYVRIAGEKQEVATFRRALHEWNEIVSPPSV